MAATFIYNTDISGHKPIIWQSQPIQKNYIKLKHHLQQHLGEDFARLFAQPVMSYGANATTKISWRCEGFDQMPAPITSLPPDEQVTYNEIVQNKLGGLLGYAQKMLVSDDPEWGQFINKAIEIPEESYILCGNGKIVLVGWGFVPNSAGKAPDGYSIHKKIPPGAPDIERRLPIPDAAPQPPLEVSENMPDGYDSAAGLVIQPAVDNTAEQVNAGTEASAATPGVTAGLQDERQTTEKPSGHTGERPLNSTPPVSGGGSGIVPPVIKLPWWKRYWWLWLILLLLLLLLLLKQCRQPVYLPPAPGVVMPIDTTKIKPDSGNNRYIVSNRLNIALTGANKNIRDFAQDLKKAYPDTDYKIIYYDTAYSRIQIQVPEDKREAVKAKLPGQLKKYQMLIWDEGIFHDEQLPNDPGFRVPEDSWYHFRIKSPAAWQYTQGDKNLVVAVVDIGFDLSQPEFKGKIYRPWNVPAHSTAVNVPRHEGYHGTHVAGIAIGNANNGQGVCGIAPGCKFMPVQVGDRNGTMSTTAIVDGLLYAINNGAKVINLSLGMGVTPRVRNLPPDVQRKMIGNLFKGEEQFWKSFFKVAEEKNVSVILAAGNDNVYIGFDPMQRSDNVIIVSATGVQNQKAVFSNYGENSTVSAPGVHIYSSLPNNRFGFLDGTSMAAPMVTGAVALLKSANPTLTFQQTKTILQQTGIPVNSSDGYVGNIIQLDKALQVASHHHKDMPALCPGVQQKIDSLNAEIAKLRQQCGVTKDTLKIPPVMKNPAFAAGRWKSTSDILDDQGQFVQLFFDFEANGKGKITLIQEDGTPCTAPLSLSVVNNKFIITQKRPAQCSPPPEIYAAYNFTCKPDAFGNAFCTAQNQQNQKNKLTFNLVKIQ